MGELKAFTITRSEWLRGEGPDCSYLHRASDDKECCLGQFLRRVHGVPAAQLLGSRTPRDMLHRLPKTAKKDVSSRMKTADGAAHRLAVINLMTINDQPRMLETEREAQIEAGFASLGYAITFED